MVITNSFTDFYFTVFYVPNFFYFSDFYVPLQYFPAKYFSKIISTQFPRETSLLGFIFLVTMYSWLLIS